MPHRYAGVQSGAERPPDAGRFYRADCGRLLREHASKPFIHAFEGKINSAVTHTPSGRHLDYRRCIDLQVQNMAGLLRGSVMDAII